MRRTISVLFLIALAVPALAVGKVTSDPNKPGAVAEAPAADLRTDAKLAQNVTYTAAKKTVSSIFADLAELTGVTLKAGRNNTDWQVRDRKMNIFAKDVPLNELMSSMARVMKFKWEISGKDGAWSYRLFMDRKSLLDAEGQRVREEQKAEEAQARKREKGLLQYAKLGNLSEADKAKLKTDSPFMYFVANSGMGGSMGAFFSESPGATEAIATGQKFEVNASSLSPAGQAGLAKSMQQMLEMEAKFGGGRGTKTVPDDMSSVTVQINHNLDMMKGFPQASMLLGEMAFKYKGGSMTVPFMDPDSTMVKMIGKALIQSEEQGRSMQDVMKEMGPEMMATVMKEIKAEVGGEAVVEHADDPALHEKITLEQPGSTLPDVEKALAEASKLAVVSDFFGGRGFPMGQVPAGESELKVVLDKIGDNYTYNWDKHGGVLELRDRNWFKKRAAQIPEAWLEAWRQELTKTGTIDIDGLAQIAALTQEQMSANVMGDDVLNSVIGSVYSAREILRLYGSLGSDQRPLLFADAGLSLRSLTQDQWAQAQKSIQARGGGTLDFNRQCSIAATRTEQGKAFGYKFVLLDASKTELSSWNMTTPSYTSPPPPKEAAPAKPADQPKPADATKSAPQASAGGDALGDSPPPAK